MSLFDKVTQELRRDVVRLVAVSLSVPTPEGCLRALAETGEDWRPKASLVFEFEPMSFRRAFEDSTDVNENLPIYFRLPVTYGSVKNGLTVEALPAIRENGFLGIPKNAMITLDRNLIDRDDKDLWMPFQRWSKRAIVAGLGDLVDYDVSTGQPTSPYIGQLFVTETGQDRFPGGATTYGRWMTYVVGKAPKDFVAAPVSERETIFLKRAEAVDEDEPTTSTASVASGVTAAALADGFEAAGLLGKSVTAYDNVEAQQIAAAKAMRFAPVFGTKVITDAADKGELIDYALEIGAITIDDNGNIVRA